MYSGANRHALKLEHFVGIVCCVWGPAGISQLAPNALVVVTCGVYAITGGDCGWRGEKQEEEGEKGEEEGSAANVNKQVAWQRPAWPKCDCLGVSVCECVCVSVSVCASLLYLYLYLLLLLSLCCGSARPFTHLFNVVFCSALYFRWL